MGSIVTRTKSDGSKTYKAQIARRRDGKGVYRESKTFTRKALAVAWLQRRELELETEEVLGKNLQRECSLSELIDLYLETFTNERTGRSKMNDMRRIQKHPIARMNVSEITTAELIEYVKERRKTVQRSTAGNDLIWIHGVMKVARPAFNINTDLNQIRDAQTLCYQLGLTGKSEERDRRPTREEMTRIMLHFNSSTRLELPYHDLLLFLLFSGRRLSEMTRIRWMDIEPKNNSVYLENVKHPRKKWGNHMRLKLTERAMKIINRQPRKKESDVIFNYDGRSLGAGFQRACKILGIIDLHLHDLRHEATSNLFEVGYQIHEVALFTGHRSWNMLKRYTHLTELGVMDKWEDWEWLP